MTVVLANIGPGGHGPTQVANLAEKSGSCRSCTPSGPIKTGVEEMRCTPRYTGGPSGGSGACVKFSAFGGLISPLMMAATANTAKTASPTRNSKPEPKPALEGAPFCSFLNHGVSHARTKRPSSYAVLSKSCQTKEEYRRECDRD